MESIPESALRNDTPEQLQERFHSFFQELHDLMLVAERWPVTATYKNQPVHITIVRRDPRKGNPCYMQRSSMLSNVRYDDIRKILFTNHSMNEPKYIQVMQDARELFGLSTSAKTAGDAGVYQLGYKATMAAGREFIELVVTQERTRSNGKREFMVVSKPVAPTLDTVRPGFVRGKYEAWELVSETGKGTVLWKCIQRSDPGGWVPKWLADRVTAKEFPKDVDSFLSYLDRH